MLTLFVVCWLPYTKKIRDVVYNKYRNTCHKSIYKWCQNVQDTSTLVLKCLKFLQWGRNVQWTLQHQCRNVLGLKCLRSEVSVHRQRSSKAFIKGKKLRA